MNIILIRRMIILHIPKELVLLIVSFLDTSSKFSLKFITKYFAIMLCSLRIKEDIIIDAVSNGYTDTVRWLMSEDDCGYCDVVSKGYFKFKNIFVAAIQSGCLEIVEWLYDTHKNEYSLGYSYYEEAASNGKFEILKWLRTKFCENVCPWNTQTCYGAAENGHFEILKWLRAKFCENGCPWNANICSGAAENGHFEILKWLRENGCPWNANTCYGAAENGHFEILKWLRENGCQWNEDACYGAAKNGHFEILKWLRENGCPWDESAYYGAAKNSHFGILRWLRENGCPCDEKNTYYHANNHGHFEISKWLRENGYHNTHNYTYPIL